MHQFFITHAATIRISFFIGMLLIMGGWELIAPRRQQKQPKVTRWFSNLGIVVLSSLSQKIIMIHTNYF